MFERLSFLPGSTSNPVNVHKSSKQKDIDVFLFGKQYSKRYTQSLFNNCNNIR